MQVIENQELLSPSICIICEERPDGKVVDTLRTGTYGGGSPFNGRKYVCSRCAEQFAKLLGFEKGSDVDQAKADVIKAQRAVEVIRERVKHFADKIVEFADSSAAINEEGDFVVSPAVVDAEAPKEEKSGSARPKSAKSAASKPAKSKDSDDADGSVDASGEGASGKPDKVSGGGES